VITPRRCALPTLVAFFFLFLFASSLVACQGRPGDSEAGSTDSKAKSDSTATDEDSDEKEEAVPVQVALLARGAMEATLQSSANLEAEREVQVFAEATRRVVELKVEEGDRVQAGQLLARLQDGEQRNALGQAKALMDKFEREKNHLQSLHERGLTTDKALNDALSDFEQQRLAVEDAERQLGYASVRAPIAGAITQRLIKVGDQLQLGQHLFDIIDFESLVARVYIPEKKLPMLRPGQSVRVVARALRNEPFMATVQRVSPIIDARSGTVKATIAVGGQAGLRPGLFVEVAIISAVHEQALLVPKRALVYDNDQIFLYRVGEDGRAQRVLVQPVLADADHVEPAGGLAEGDQVIIAGQAGLKDGAKIEVVDPDAPEEQLAESDGDGDTGR